MTDNRQTTRTFQCREALWACFEQMARELECSVDYLLNDAMKQYARQRGYNSMGADSHSPGPTSSSLPPSLRPSTPMGRAPLPPVPAPGMGAPQMGGQMMGGQMGGMGGQAMGGMGGPLPPVPQPGRPAPSPYYGAPPRAPSGAPMPPQAQPVARRPPPAPLPPPPATRQIPAVNAGMNAGMAAGMQAQPGYYVPSSVPPQANYINNSAPPVAAPQGQPGGVRPTVNIYYMGERFPVTKDRFIIGRGRQSSDLTIKDPNVSRQHAMIEYLNGYYYIVDMGSTNGVEYAGQRIQRRVVGEGDTFRVCDHELRFSYH
ncbi:MAG TPA: FHA domain-containing protein [Polyangiaceae bacterium]|nr:FHA domain-containing protein [Polyangiaceae bacterium]